MKHKLFLILGFLFIILSSISFGDLTEHLQGYWSLNSSTNIIDSLGRNNGTISGTLSADSGKFNNGLNLTGSGSSSQATNRMRIPLSGVSSATDTFTIRTYSRFKTGTAGYHYFMLGSADNNFPLNVRLGGTQSFDTNIQDGVGNTLSTASVNYKVDNTYHCYIFEVRNGNNTIIYEDGTILLNFTGTTRNSNNPTFLGLQHQGTSENYGSASQTGWDEIALWNRTLTATEKAQVCDNTTTSLYPAWITPTSSNFSITAKNNYNNASINTFNATINGVNYTTTTGTITTGLLSNATSLYNITIISENFFNKTYNNYNVSTNLNATLDQYPIIYLSNAWNNTNLTTSQIRIDGNTYNTTTTFIYVPYNETKNVLINTSNYLGLTYSTSLIQNTLNKLNASQSIITLQIKNIVDNSSFSNFTIRFNSSIFCNTTGSSCTNYPNAGTYLLNATPNVASDFHLPLQNITISGLQNETITLYAHDHTIYINARDSVTNASINNFSVNVKSLNTSYETNYSTSTGTIEAFAIHNTYNLTIDAPGYALYNNVQSQAVTTDHNVTFYLQKNNGVAINIYNEANGSAIIGTDVNVYTYLNATLIYTNITNSSQISFYELTPGNYTFRFEATNYAVKEYYVSVGNRSFQNLDAYLLQTSYSTIFNLLDQSNANTIEGASVIVKRYINGSLEVVSSLTSDITGRVQLSFQQNTPYYFTITKTGYTTKEFTLNPIIFSSYNVQLTPTTTQTYEGDYSGVSITFNPNILTNNAINTLTFTFGSPAGVLVNYGFNITYGSAFNSSTGANAYGSTLSTNINITGATIGSKADVYYFYETSDGAINKYHFKMDIPTGSAGNYTIFSNKGQTYGLGSFERILIVTIIAFLIVGAGVLFSGAFVGAVLGLFIFSFFAYMGFITWWVVYPIGLILFIYIVWGSSR